jgi:hypothetical protein
MKKLILLSGMVFALAACGNEPKEDKKGSQQAPAIDPSSIENPITATQTDISGADLPVLSFEKEVHEFPGEITEGEKVSYTFKLKNTGKAPLIISNASAPCGCTIPEVPREPIPPGGEGSLNVVFNSEGKPGRNEKAIIVESNAIPKTKELRIIVNVKAKN